MERKIHFRENWLIFWGFGELNYFRDFGSKAKYFPGAEDFFQGFGEINALF